MCPVPLRNSMAEGDLVSKNTADGGRGVQLFIMGEEG